MHKTAKIVTVILISVLMLAFAATHAFAAGSVSYRGQAERFIFAPGSDSSPTDLFESFKNVMPGDSLKQTVEVRNDASNGVKVKIYLRAAGAAEGEEFLSQLRLTVAKRGENSKMFDAAADEKGGLADWTLLGTLYSGGREELEVTLDVPITLGNGFQDAVGKVAWEFKVEEFPIEDDDPTPPVTGDESRFWLWAALAAASFAGVAAILLMVLRKRGGSEEKQ